MEHQGNKKRAKSGWAKLNSWIKITPLLFLISMYVIIYAAGEHEWLGRIIALSIFFPVATIVALWYGISPKTQMIKKGGKLNSPEFKKAKIYVSFFFRLVFVFLGIGLLWYEDIPLAFDINNLFADKRPMMKQGCIYGVPDTLYGMWYLHQTVPFSKKAKENCHLFFSLKPRLAPDIKYEFFILPHSRLILEAHEIKDINTVAQ